MLWSSIHIGVLLGVSKGLAYRLDYQRLPYEERPAARRQLSYNTTLPAVHDSNSTLAASQNTTLPHISGFNTSLAGSHNLTLYQADVQDHTDGDDSDDGILAGEDEGYYDYELCDYSLTFNNLDDLAAAAGGFRTDCIAAYTLDTLSTMLDAAYADYTFVNDGYDEDFGAYVTYIQKLVPSALDNNVMFDEADTTNTMAIPVPGPGMQYFDCQTNKKHSTVFPCTDLNTTSRQQEMSGHKTTLTLRDQDGYTTALSQAGIDPSWATLGDHEVDQDFVAGRGGRRFKYHFSGYPIENPQIVVSNPKDIVTKALPSIPDLQVDMQATLMEIILGTWTNGSVMDAAQAYSTPVFMLMSAVDSMAQAKAMAVQELKDEKQEEARKKNFILLIVSVVLMFIPVVGEEIAAAAGFASLARAIAIAGELGNAALGIYDTVQDPKAAIVNILGMLVGVGVIAKASRDGPGIAGIANIRRSMSADEVSGLGNIFKANDDKLQGILKVCRL